MCPACSGKGGFDTWSKPCAPGHMHFKKPCQLCNGQCVVMGQHNMCGMCAGKGGFDTWDKPSHCTHMHYKRACVPCGGRGYTPPMGGGGGGGGYVQPVPVQQPRQGGGMGLGGFMGAMVGAAAGAVIGAATIADKMAHMDMGGETIIRAWYGERAFGGRGVDVTRKVRKHHAKGNLRIKADNVVFGDPAHGVQKHLWIEYRSGRGPQTVSAKEHDFCTLEVGPGSGGGPGGGGHHGGPGPGHHHHPAPPHMAHGGGHHHGGGGGPLQVGRKYHLQHKSTRKNVAVMPNGRVHATGGSGAHATFTVEANRGAIQFKNDKGNYLACQNGNMKSGGGGKWCDFTVRPHEGHILIRSSHGDHGVGFEPNGEVRESHHVKHGDLAQFQPHPC